MYYKIENTECDVYKKLHEMRTNEIKIDDENEKAVNDKIGLDYKSFFGYTGQLNFGRVTLYCGFEFTEPDKVDLKVWKRNKERPEIFEPNSKTKAGREMSEFLSNGLKKSYFNIPHEILGLEHPRRFSYPFVEIVGDIITLFLDDSMEPEDENVIEITRKEFNELRKFLK